ncbi:MAG: tRNA (adenosine(37)-N6)-threonylcarbamoyltransferase complex ATPase subunit type 1 TsaE [Prevotellaceae bacterium]|nr:tRNA (adenosine(37)-N6)-threonylcarbamoyltransferase complex ATPase subunit type 1 TsaE [Prevotellaceae bacterium]
MTINIPDTDQIDRAAQQFLPLLDKYNIFAFHGGMGAGKTTFINALCKALGVEDPTGSPTFAIVNEYALPNRSKTIYHFDFYRIKSINEVYDIGYEEYFFSGQPCLLEWPEMIEPLLPEDTVNIFITVNPDNSRTLKIELPD